MSETYTPKRGEVAGLDLYGERQDDGTIKLGSAPSMGDDHRTHVREFPEEIEVEGVVYTLEFVKENHWQGREQLEKDDPSDMRLRICWGVYV